MDWWYEHYDRELGMFHQVKWHRIVVDGNRTFLESSDHSTLTSCYRRALRQKSRLAYIHGCASFERTFHVDSQWDSSTQVSTVMFFIATSIFWNSILTVLCLFFLAALRKCSLTLISSAFPTVLILKYSRSAIVM